MSRKTARKINYDDIKIGKRFGFERLISREDVAEFAKLTGDYSPLHTQEKYAGKTEFGGIIVHGLHLCALFSALLGMYCPGEKTSAWRKLLIS
jgi:acyl dehydratase